MKELLDHFEQGLRAGSSNHARVVEGLGQAIVSGHPPTGDLLPRDDELAEEFGVSRTVLREAMKTLAAKGMVVPKARVGTRVQPRTEWNMFDAQMLRWHLEGEQNDAFYEQLFQMRLAFEPYAAGLAAEKAREKDIEALDRSVQAMRDAEDERAFSAADMEFHRGVLHAAGNAFFYSVVSLVGAALLSLLRLSSPELRADQQKTICDGHQRIADAIRARDIEAAQEAMRAVIKVGWSRVFGQPGSDKRR